jgi:zinc protease
MKRRFLCVLAALGFALVAETLYAQKYDISATTLKNGLDVIVIRNPAVPLVTIEIDVKNGGYTESPEYNGLSHFYEHMFFKANKAIPSQERYLERMRELGASWNGTTSDERVNYFVTLTKDSLEPGMVFMFDAITAPLFLEEEIVKERTVVTGEYDRAESNPLYLLNRAVDRKVWWKYYSYKNVLGDRQVLMTTTPQKMQSIQNRFYFPNNSALLLAGDISADQGFRLAEKYFSSWKRGPDPFKTFKTPKHPPIQKTDTVVVERPVNAVTIMIKWQGPSVGKDRAATYTADILSYIVGQQTSKFYKSLVESGLAYSASIGYQTLDHTGPITLSAQTSARNVDTCRKVIFEQIHTMTSDDYFTDDQIENAKTILAIGEQYGRERASQFVHTVGYWWAVAGLDYYLNYIDNLRRVSRSDIKRYLATYVIGKPYVMGVLVSPEQRKEIGM